MTKAISPTPPLKAVLVAMLALIVTVGISLWAAAATAPKVAANNPAVLQLKPSRPIVIVPPPTITPLVVGSATPTSSAAPNRVAPAPAAKNRGEQQKGDGKNKGQHKP